jgi:hypothetical protein
MIQACGQILAWWGMSAALRQTSASVCTLLSQNSYNCKLLTATNFHKTRDTCVGEFGLTWTQRHISPQIQPLFLLEIWPDMYFENLQATSHHTEFVFSLSL